MSYKPKSPLTREETRPRLLTKNEIKDILSVIPLPDSDDVITAKIGRGVILESVRSQLQTIMLADSDLARQMMKDAIAVRFAKAKVRRASPVGSYVSDAFGATSTQITLDTFKASGVSPIGRGLDGFTSLLYARVDRKDSAMIIHFSRPITQQQVVDMRSVIEEATIKRFVKKIDIGAFHRVDDPNKFPLTEDRRKLFSDEQFRLESTWWYRTYDAMHPGEPSEYPTHIMRLYLDVQLMYEHRITTQMISDAFLNNDSRRKKQKRNSNDISYPFSVVASPFSEGIIDIVARGPIVEIAGDMVLPVKAFLQNTILPSLDQIFVRKGISGITKIIPMTVNMIGMIKDSQRIKSDDSRYQKKIASFIAKHQDDPQFPKLADRLWVLSLNYVLIHYNSIDFRRIRDLIKGSGMTIIAEIVNQIQRKAEKIYRRDGFIFPNDPQLIENIIVYVPEDTNPNEFLIDKVRSNPRLETLSKYVYALTTGSNLREILSLPWVDDQRTVTNNIHELSEVFGVEAARNYFLYELNEILIASGVGQLSSRNLTLSADFIFSRGYPLGVKFAGESKRGSAGFFSLGVYEKFKRTIFDAASTGSYESATSASVAQFTGRHPQLGAFAFETDTSDETLTNLRRMVDAEKNRTLIPAPVTAPVAAPVPAPVETFDPANLIQSLTSVDIDIGFVSAVTAQVPTRDLDVITTWPDVDMSFILDLPMVAKSVVFNMDDFNNKYLSNIERPIHFYEYKEMIRKTYEMLPSEETQPQEEDSFIPDTSQISPIASYLISGYSGLVYDEMRSMLNGKGWEELQLDDQPAYVDYIQIGQMGEKLNTATYDIKSLVKNVLGAGKDMFTQKDNLYFNMVKLNPEIAKKHMAPTRYLEQVTNFPESPDRAFIIRPVGAGVFSGRDIRIIQSVAELNQAKLELSKEHNKILISSYVNNPLLWTDRKMHIRMHFMIRLGPEVPDGYSYELCGDGFIMTAAEPYQKGDYGNPQIHDTHAKSTPRDLFFPDDLTPPVKYPHSKDIYVQNILSQMRNILNAVGEIARGNIQNHPETRNGFEVFGVDFLVTDDLVPKVVLMEINDHVGYGPSGIDRPSNWNPTNGPWVLNWVDFSRKYFNWIYQSTIEPILTNKTETQEVVTEVTQIIVPPSVHHLPVDEWIRNLNFDTEPLTSNTYGRLIYTQDDYNRLVNKLKK